MDGRMASRESAPYVSPRQQAMVLRVLWRLYCFTGVFAGGLRMLPGMRTAFNLLFQLSVLHFALQKTCAGHQDGIVHFLAQFKRLRRLGAGIIKIANIQIKQSAVFQHAADAMMMIVVAVDFLRKIQVGESAAA